MKRQVSLLLGCVLVACVTSAAWAATPASDATFVVTIDPALQKKFGFQYPVTYVFQLSEGMRYVSVYRRDGNAGAWKVLDKKVTSDFFNGVECVRLDAKSTRAYVSVGFKGTNTLQLRFKGARSVKF